MEEAAVLQFRTIFMLSGHEIPRLAVPLEFVLQRGQKAVIECNLTYKGSGTPRLTKLLWFNGDRLLKTQENPSAEALPAFVIQNPGFEDVGNYTCVLGVMLRRLIAYNVTAETTVRSKWSYLKNEYRAIEILTVRDWGMKTRWPS